MANSRTLIVAFLCLALPALLVFPLWAIEMPEPRIQARVDFDSMSEWQRFLAVRDLDLMNVKCAHHARIVTDAEQLEQLRSLGFAVTVEIENMEEFYACRISGDNFGDYHTYSETEQFLDDLHASWPWITTAKMTIGTSHEGRDIWAMKISDNPESNEDEPEVLFDALHHAREPMSLEVVLYYMTWLCENYGNDPDAAFLVDNREIWFVPVVNPDGYVFNEMTYPAGGGMWRKNRRDNGDGTWGVDPNRNYPYEWGRDDGSSSDPASQIYRGPYAASEPEVRAVMNLMKDHEFFSHLTFHSVAGMILVPWSFTSSPPPDDWILRRWGNEMAKFNDYAVGQSNELLYLCSGTTGDYAYGEQVEKNKIMSCCVEVAGSGFWPEENEIPALNEECLWPQICATWVAGVYLELGAIALSGGNEDGKPDPGETLELVAMIKNEALSADAENAVITLSTDDPYVQLHDASSFLGAIVCPWTVQNTEDPFRFSLHPSTPDGHLLAMTIALNADGFSRQENTEWNVGRPFVSLSDDMENGIGNWISGDHSWGLTTSISHSPDYSYADSPVGDYSNLTNTWIELTNPLDLSQVDTANLSFWHWHNTEENADYCYVEASDDDGGTWRQIGSRYHGTSEDWEQVALSLADYVGSPNFTLRFRLESDPYVTADGWYIDDVLITEPPNMNTRPTAPTLLSPVDGSMLYTPSPTLAVLNSSDADRSDKLTYGFFLYADELLTQLVASASNIPPRRANTEWTVDLTLDDGTYWWQAYADDGTERSPLMSAASFTVDASRFEIPSTVALLGPQPNPFEDEMLLGFELPSRSDTRITIYNLHGRTVRTLIHGKRGQGRGNVTWDGSDNRGRRVASGAYQVRLEACGVMRSRKLVVLR